MDYQMDDFDPYAEPKLDLEQTKSPPAAKRQGTPRQEKVGSRVEFQDVDPHVTLSYNGLSSTYQAREIVAERCSRNSQGGY